MKIIFKEAHKMTKEIVEKYKGVDYQAQFGLCVSYLLELEGVEENEELNKIIETGCMTEEEIETARKWINRNNEINKDRVVELIKENKNVRMRLSNAGLYNYKTNALGTVKDRLKGKGKIETANLKFWSNYGKKRIYFDMMIDGVVVDNFFIAVK